MPPPLRVDAVPVVHAMSSARESICSMKKSLEHWRTATGSTGLDVSIMKASYTTSTVPVSDLRTYSPYFGGVEPTPIGGGFDIAW